MTGVKAVIGGFGLLKAGLGEVGYGFQTLGSSATMGGMTALKFGAQDLGKGLLLVGGMAAIAGVAVATYLGVRAVQAAADFQQGLNRLVTGAGDVTDNMRQMGASILGISTSTGVLTGELLPAMYQIISAGQRGAQAQDTLKVAAMGAVAEQAKVVDVAKALTTAMTDYGTTQYNATQFMNGYTRATQLGKVTLEELSTSMGPILPLAKNIGVSFADVAGAMSTMTNAGIPAERAATSLRFLFQSLEVPTTKAKNAMQSMGLSSVAVGNELKVSLPGALDMIYKAALRAGPEGSVPFNRAVSDMIGGQRSLQAYLALTGTHFATFSANAKAVADAMNHSKTAVLGWDVAQGNFNVKMGQAHAALDALAITVGSALLPVLTRIVGQITPLVVSFTQWAVQSGTLQSTMSTLGAILSGLVTGIVTVVTWGARMVQFFQQNQIASALLGATLIFLAVIIGTVLVVALYAYTAAAIGAAVANIALFWPVYLVILIIIVVIALVILAVRNWGAIAHWLQGVWGAVIGWLGGAWHSLVGIASSVGNAIAGAFNAAIAWIVAAWHSAIAFIVGIWNTLRGAAATSFTAISTTIMSVVNAVITWLVGIWHTCVNAIAAAFTWLYNHNYIWQALVDFIRNAVQAVITWLQGAWQTCVSFISSVWSTLSGLASSAWGASTNVIMSVVNAVISWLQGAWQSAISWLSGAWNTLAGLASSLWNSITSVISSAANSAISFLRGAWTSAAAFLSGIWNSIKAAVVAAWNFIVSQFAAAWGRISGPLNSLGAGIRNFFAGLASQAISWGANIIRGIINGINSMIGGVIGAASNIASTITGILGFHSPPPEGPAADADSWMPNMVAMLTRGMTAGVPSVARAASSLAQPIQGGLSINVAGPIQGGLSTAGPGPASTPSTTTNDNRPLIVQIGTQEYRGFIQNLGRDLQGTIIIQKGGLR